MAEIITKIATHVSPSIAYSEGTIQRWSHRLSRLKPVEPGDVCCNCGGDCDGVGFAWENFTAKRVNGHPLCSRPKCLDAQMDEFWGKRSGCSCGKKNSER